jgi:hypothetical protein
VCRVSYEQAEIPTASQTLKNWLVMSEQPCGIEGTPRRYRKALSRKVLRQETASGCLRMVSSKQDSRVDEQWASVCLSHGETDGPDSRAAVAQTASHDCGSAAARRGKLQREGVALYVQVDGRRGLARQASVVKEGGGGVMVVAVWRSGSK